MSGIERDFSNRDHEPVRDIQIAQFAGNFEVIDHAAPGEGDFAAVPLGGVSHLLHPGDQARQRLPLGHASFRFLHDLIQGGVNHPLGFGPTRLG